MCVHTGMHDTGSNTHYTALTMESSARTQDTTASIHKAARTISSWVKGSGALYTDIDELGPDMFFIRTSDIRLTCSGMACPYVVL